MAVTKRLLAEITPSADNVSLVGSRSCVSGLSDTSGGLRVFTPRHIIGTRLLNASVSRLSFSP